jgi:acetyltransferase-like isoleucine patch superfamily enzyme
MSNDLEGGEISFRNFIADAWVRSLSCKEWVYRFARVGESSGWNQEQLAELRELYQRITAYLRSHISLERPQGMTVIDEVAYHSRYGWVVSGGGDKAYLGKAVMPDDLSIQIGRQAYLSGNAMLRGTGLLKIGGFTSIAEGLYLNTSSDLHPTQYPAMINFATERRCCDEGYGMGLSFEQITSQRTGIAIGSDVWIGRNVRIFYGSHIAHGCVLAEQSLVRGETEPYGIYAGVPAKLKKFRFSELTIAALLEIQWWNWSKEKLLRNMEFFATNLVDFKGDPRDLVVS